MHVPLYSVRTGWFRIFKIVMWVLAPERLGGEVLFAMHIMKKSVTSDRMSIKKFYSCSTFSRRDIVILCKSWIKPLLWPPKLEMTLLLSTFQSVLTPLSPSFTLLWLHCFLKNMTVIPFLVRVFILAVSKSSRSLVHWLLLMI